MEYFNLLSLKKSIKGYDLIAGERRLRASKLAGMETIPAIVKEFSDEEMREKSHYLKTFKERILLLLNLLGHIKELLIT